MIFITGPAFSGKQEFICKRLGWSEEDFNEKAVRDVQELAGCVGRTPEEIADLLSGSEVVIADETGCGIIPEDAAARKKRELAGELCQILAARADTVIRVVCGIPRVLKGEMP